MTRYHVSFIAISLPLLTVVFLPIVSLFFVPSVDDILKGMQSATFGSALWVSLWTSVCCLFSIILFATPLAWWISQQENRIWEDICIIPLLVPPTVIGLGLLYAFGQQGILGGVLSEWNIQIAFHPMAVILAQVVVSSPLYIRTMTHTFREIPQQSMVLGQTLGFSEMEVFRILILPSCKESIISAGILTWARAIGEFGATLLFAGSLIGKTQTVPLAIYNAFMQDVSVAVSLSISLIVLSLLLFLFLRWSGTRI
jgi:molybdate transport system permease protein